jgi:hypothetical protein
MRSRLFTFTFFRSMLTSFGNRSPYSAKSREFTPYFQYKIGPYQSDYYLYFAKQPYLQVYKNEIFMKMYEYAGYDLIRYLEFHYEAFENKTDFIRFLRYDVSERLSGSAPKKHKLKLQATSDWLLEKQEKHIELQEKTLKAQIEQDVRSTLDEQVNSGVDIDAIAQSLSEKIATRLDQVILEQQEDGTQNKSPGKMR